MNTTTVRKITLATIKSFVKKNEGNLWINVKSSFDGMTDCVESLHRGFKQATKGDHYENSLGIQGAWFVGQSRDYFKEYHDPIFDGFEVYNSCGSFILATK